MPISGLKHRFALARHTRRHGDAFSIHGVTVHIPPEVGDRIRYRLLKGRYENAEADAIGRHLKFGSDVIELGGSLGVVSAVIRHAIGPDARHVVVEALPHLARICRRNAGPEPQTKVVEAAVHYGSETVSFLVGKNAHVGRVSNAGSDGEKITVPAVTLSALAETHLGPSAPFSLVCDIEGAEWALFEQETTLSSQIDRVIIEIHPDRFEEMGQSRSAFLDLIAARGFTVLEDLGDVLVLGGQARA